MMSSFINLYQLIKNQIPLNQKKNQWKQSFYVITMLIWNMRKHTYKENWKWRDCERNRVKSPLLLPQHLKLQLLLLLLLNKYPNRFHLLLFPNLLILFQLHLKFQYRGRKRKRKRIKSKIDKILVIEFQLLLKNQKRKQKQK